MRDGGAGGGAGGMGGCGVGDTAAQAGYAQKYATYVHLLKPGDRLLAVPAESWGALHGSALELLERWAKALRQEGADACGPPTTAQDTIARDILQIWKMRLSVALMHGRVDYVMSAARKVQGIRGPARTAAEANELRVGNPIRRAQLLGQLVGGGAVGRGRWVDAIAAGPGGLAG